MSKPRRVQINGEWYDVSEWMSGLQLSKFGSPNIYKASEPFAHITGLYHVYNSSGSKIGEFSLDNRTCSGCVTDFDA